MRKVRADSYSLGVSLGGSEDDYKRSRPILNSHPTYIGRNTIKHYAREGGLVFFMIDDQDVAVACMNMKKNVLIVLNVKKEFRGRGVGEKVMAYLKPNFVRAVEAAVPWFERLGYKKIGRWIQGRKLRTRVMVRASIIDLAGRLKNIFGE